MKIAATALKWACEQLVHSHRLDLKNLVKMSRIRFPGGDQTLFHLLKTARNFQISDDRDKVFALLGHGASQKAKQDFPVSYKGSYTYGKVYIKTAQLLLKQDRGLRGLSLVGHTSKTLEDTTIPSWVPQWNIGYHSPVLVRQSWRPRTEFVYCSAVRSHSFVDFSQLVLSSFAGNAMSTK